MKFNLLLRVKAISHLIDFDLVFPHHLFQDFRLVKVLSGDSDKSNDNNVQETGNEYYIRRNKENGIPKAVPKQPNLETNQISNVDETTLGPDPTQISPEPKYLTTGPPRTTSATTSDTNDILKYLNVPAIKADAAQSTPKNTSPSSTSSLDYEIIIREGKEVITIYPETITKLLNSFAPPVAQPAPENLTDVIKVVSPYESSTTQMPLWEEEVRKKYPLALDSDEDHSDPELIENETKNDKLEEIDFIKRIKDSFENQSEVEVRVSTGQPKRWDDYVENIVLPIENIDDTQTELNEWGNRVSDIDDDDDDEDDENEDSYERGYDSDEDDDYVSSGERLSSYRKVYSR